MYLDPTNTLLSFIFFTYKVCASPIADRVTEIELQLQGQLDEQKAPTLATGLPWKDLIKSPDRTDPD